MASATKHTTVAQGVPEVGAPFQRVEFELPSLLPKDVEVRVSHCGFCHTDLHEVDGHFGPRPGPIIPGHEVVGVISAVGSEVKDLKVGARVGISYQIDSCGNCNECKSGFEVYCQVSNVLGTGGKRSDGSISRGGFALHMRANERFIYPIPDKLDSAATAPLLCAGITMYTPLKEAGVKQGTRVGVIGIGGLGHVGLQIANAMGAVVTAISGSPDKEAEAKSFGAARFLNNKDPAQMKAAAGSLDVILNTVSGGVEWDHYLALLAPRGTFFQLGVPDKAMQFNAVPLLFKGISVRGSLTGPPSYIREMLDICAKHDVKAQIEVFPWDKAQAGRERLASNKARYRVVIEMPKETK